MKRQNKEKIFWKRQWKMRKRFPPFFRWFPVGYPLLALLIAIGHYAFAFMTLLHKIWTLMSKKRKSKVVVSE